MKEGQFILIDARTKVSGEDFDVNGPHELVLVSARPASRALDAIERGFCDEECVSGGAY